MSWEEINREGRMRREEKALRRDHSQQQPTSSVPSLCFSASRKAGALATLAREDHFCPGTLSTHLFTLGGLMRLYRRSTNHGHHFNSSRRRFLVMYSTARNVAVKGAR